MSSFLTLSKNGTFTLGDLLDGREQIGLTGTWKANEGMLILAVQTSESCKVKEGQEIRYAYRLSDNELLELSDPDTPEDMLRLRRRE